MAGACVTPRLDSVTDGGTRDVPASMTLPTDASVGMVTFHAILPEAESFCEQYPACPYVFRNLRINRSTGEALALPNSAQCWGTCEPTCGATCFANYCPPQGKAVVRGNWAWDGRHDVTVMCGSACPVRTYAPAGEYTVQLCATPGVLMPTDAAVDEFGTMPAACAATGTERCGPVVRFTFPSATPVELPLQ
jgi:hypothetical protein